MSKIILKYSMKGEYLAKYVTLSEAAAESGISKGAISHAARGRANTAGGYVWRYAEEDNMKITVGPQNGNAITIATVTYDDTTTGASNTESSGD